jgi:hypothetical protein
MVAVPDPEREPVTDDDEVALPVALPDRVPVCDGETELDLDTDGAADADSEADFVDVWDLVMETMAVAVLVAEPVALVVDELTLEAEPVTELDALGDAAPEAVQAPENDCDAVDVRVVFALSDGDAAGEADCDAEAEPQKVALGDAVPVSDAVAETVVVSEPVAVTHVVGDVLTVAVRFGDRELEPHAVCETVVVTVSVLLGVAVGEEVGAADAESVAVPDMDAVWQAETVGESEPVTVSVPETVAVIDGVEQPDADGEKVVPLGGDGVAVAEPQAVSVGDAA